ncbi:hypothetical protein DPMN_029828 [Dreissena polymorpha]|uniref:Uncharacterized protein n=1 Tax=Dreissena polymorpha TaxID=45954 RepID=A0A9D4RFU2_DREPO|nr:hypothetical protein DPMN_029828 [Dreissena polymorpha]
MDKHVTKEEVETESAAMQPIEIVETESEQRQPIEINPHHSGKYNRQPPIVAMNGVDGVSAAETHCTKTATMPFIGRGIQHLSHEKPLETKRAN